MRREHAGHTSPHDGDLLAEALLGDRTKSGRVRDPIVERERKVGAEHCRRPPCAVRRRGEFVRHAHDPPSSGRKRTESSTANSRVNHVLRTTTHPVTSAHYASFLPNVGLITRQWRAAATALAAAVATVAVFPLPKFASSRLRTAGSGRADDYVVPRDDVRPC